MRLLNLQLPLRLLVIAGIIVAGASEVAASDVASPVPAPSAGNAVAGKQTFTQYCSVCHGAAARGFIGPWIAGVNWTTPGLHAIVRGGVGGYGSMPAFNAAAVSDKDIADIAAYLATLPAASPPRAAAGRRGR